jgi:hypothetical protein
MGVSISAGQATIGAVRASVFGMSVSSSPAVAETLTADVVLRMPEIDAEVPMAEFYAGVELADEAGNKDG